MTRIIRKTVYRPRDEGGCIPALLKCDCGHEMELLAPTNTCEECGADYNRFGQRLAPREQWGWDTGETADDILEAGHHIG